MSKKMYGWTGTLLRVDLTTGKIVKQATPKELALNFLGGEGLGWKVIYDEVPPGVDPFDPEMVFVVGIGPLSGTLFPSSGRLEVISKSPLSKIVGDSNAGGFFAPEVKWAGYDSIIIKGKSNKPVYLWVDDDSVEIRDAARLWGKSPRDTVSAIREELGDPSIKVMSIGPAGENLVGASAVFCDDARAAGHTGIAANLGAKNFKAVAARGTKGVEIADLEAFEKISFEVTEKINKAPRYEIFSKGGTLGSLMDNLQKAGLLPTLHHQECQVPPEEYYKLSYENFLKKHHIRDMACFGCPIAVTMCVLVKVLMLEQKPKE